MLNSRLRTLPRRNPPSKNEAPVPAPDFGIQNDQEQELEEEDQEDLFGAFLPHLFPDDAPVFHGDPGQHLLYSSPRYGNLNIMVPSHPSSSEKTTEESGQKEHGTAKQDPEGWALFAHFLWSAAMVVAEGVEEADTPIAEGEVESKAHKEAREIWGVCGESVLELGAGAALPSIVCALASASRVAATDHPSSPALNGAITFNIDHNLTKRVPAVTAKTSMHPHEWGVLSDPFSTANKGSFSRIVAADCFWMPEQHENLTKTMQWFLSPGGKVLVVAGFHTGRNIVAQFFEAVVRGGFVVERIFERDTVERLEDGGEIRREWMPVRDGESVNNRMRWCVVAVLKRAEE